MENRSYFAIIPATVRYDKRLPDGAKLLYGEITALCNDKGFCWASNGYFADLYGKSKKTISRWVASLEENGYIWRNVHYKEGTKEIDMRCISIRENKQIDSQNPPVKTVQQCPYPPDKNVPDNSTLNNTVNRTEEDPPDKITRDFNSICSKLNPIRFCTEGRKQEINARFREGYTYDDFRRLFELAQSSYFLTGQNRRGWKATFDWLIDAENFPKVLEGNYSNSLGREDKASFDIDFLEQYWESNISKYNE